MKRLIILLFSFLLGTSVASAATRLSLEQAESMAMATSPNVQTSRAMSLAATEQAKSEKATFFPQLSLEANYQYQSEIPVLNFAGISQPLGTHEGYSFGPVLSYTLWDSGARRHIYHSLLLNEKSRQSDQQLIERQLLLSTRMAYVQVQFGQQELAYVKESFESAKRQSRDIEKRFHSGAVSRLDFLQSQMDVTNYEVRTSQSQAELAAALADLNALIGPAPQNATWDLETLDASTTNIEKKRPLQMDAHHPKLQSRQTQVESLEEAALGETAGHWPQLQFRAKASMDYPDGPDPRQFRQNTMMLNMEWPLFEFGHVSAKVEQKKAEALGARHQGEQEVLDLTRDWIKTNARFDSLLQQRQSAEQSVLRGQELARLKFSAYRLGKSSFSEVQTINLELLEAQIRKAQIEAQMLIQYHSLRFLAEKENL